MGLDRNVGLVGILTKLLKQKDKGSFPTTKKLKELMKEESVDFLNEVKENLTNKEGAKNFYLKVKEEVKKILVIVSNLPDLESIDANGKKKLSNLKLEAEKGAKGQAQLMREASEKKYLKDPKILEWFSYAGGIMVGEYEKLAETKTYSSVSVEDSWYTRMQSNTTTSEYSDPVTKKQSIFSKAKKGKIGKAYDRSEDLDENYKAELDDRGIRDTHSKYDKNKSSYNIAPQYVKGTVKGTLKGLRNGALVGGALGTAGGAFLGPVGALAGGAVGTAVGAPIGLAVGALRGGVKAVKRKTKNIENERKGYLKDFDREKDLINRLKDGRK